MPPAIDAPAVPVVAVVGSAGGISALEVVLARLPTDFPAAVVALIHLTPNAPSVLHSILARATGLPFEQARDGGTLAAGVVAVAPPDSHLLVGSDGRFQLDRSELVHHVRPSADSLLLSLARNHRGRLAAVVLSGAGSDGAEGSAAVKRAGGLVIAQDEATAEHFGMPGAAIDAGGVDAVLPLDAIAPALLEWVA